MKMRSTLPFRVAAVVTMAALVEAQQSSGLVQQYCSTQNTGVNYPGGGVMNIYQSNGACKTQCQTGYAFGIVQGNTCWCSNYIPAAHTDVSKCNQTCPGFPTDLCGSTSAGLFGYIAMNIVQPQGTYGLSSTSTTSTSASSSSTPLQNSPVSSPIVQTITQSQDATTVVSYVTLLPVLTSDTGINAASLASPPSDTSSSTSSSSSSVTPVMSTQVITLSGAVITQTVTTTPFSTAAQDASLKAYQQQGLSGGAIAGIVIGVAAAVALVLLGAFCVWRRKRRTGDDVAVGAAAAASNEKAGFKRNTSVLSRSGLLARLNNDHNEKDPFDEPANAGSASQRNSMLFGAGAGAADGVSPVSPLETSYSNESRRHSKPLVYDQRLNPSALFASHDNGSRVSMQDGADYSRTLGVTNPDPRASWESRVSRG